MTLLNLIRSEKILKKSRYLMLLIALMTGLASAKITQDTNGKYYITSQNIREIAIIKAERDYYRELVLKLPKNNIGVALGIGTNRGVYGQVDYRF